MKNVKELKEYLNKELSEWENELNTCEADDSDIEAMRDWSHTEGVVKGFKLILEEINKDNINK